MGGLLPVALSRSATLLEEHATPRKGRLHFYTREMSLTSPRACTVTTGPSKFTHKPAYCFPSLRHVRRPVRPPSPARS
jgi:hypothetical protein